jgi:hypothetical protein
MSRVPVIVHFTAAGVLTRVVLAAGFVRGFAVRKIHQCPLFRYD